MNSYSFLSDNKPCKSFIIVFFIILFSSIRCNGNYRRSNWCPTCYTATRWSLKYRCKNKIVILCSFPSISQRTFDIGDCNCVGRIALIGLEPVTSCCCWNRSKWAPLSLARRLISMGRKSRSYVTKPLIRIKARRVEEKVHFRSDVFMLPKSAFEFFTFIIKTSLQIWNDRDKKTSSDERSWKLDVCHATSIMYFFFVPDTMNISSWLCLSDSTLLVFVQFYKASALYISMLVKYFMPRDMILVFEVPE